MTSDKSPTQPTYWFPAKRYGIGWGLPICWQGWVVQLVPFVLFFGACLFHIRTGSDLLFYAVMPPSIFVTLVLYCWKGEPLRWRWGGK